MAAEEPRWFPSKIDWWLVPFLCLPPLGAITVCVASALSRSAPEMMIGVAVAVIVGGLYFGLVFPMRYGLSDTCLLVRFGICRQRIPLADIREVHPTRNPLSSPALSLDRLRIRFGPRHSSKTVMISPANMAHFLDELAQRTGLRREGDRLLRE